MYFYEDELEYSEAQELTTKQKMVVWSLVLAGLVLLVSLVYTCNEATSKQLNIENHVKSTSNGFPNWGG
ncbi:hypothetical protein [Pedobacter sp. SYSU D00535]|uniref:hypothetical protein n=1 Tax=Pedobacter sp. SYSU D00535 TaxID=2810308 RepID=UPI001A95BE6F|nr:hypothetical protein [Pedobacter sp. SYSU D00535]